MMKYHGIVAGSTLESLPPKREVSHCIDLILGAILPKNVVYKMALQKNEEISKQVKEMHKKEIIKQSLSLFVPGYQKYFHQEKR